ncbi:MAG: hydrogenase maturation protease [Candidatus Dormiibacterota bacterium]|jgi:Ni,Fe-hydrogenase maturation factor
MARQPAAARLRGVLVIACGNTLRGDDGAGPEVGELLAAELEGTGAEVVVVDQLLPELALDASRSGRVVFVDAAADVPPGSVSVRPVHPGQDAPGDGGAEPPSSTRRAPGGAGRSPDPFSHGLGPEDVLRLARDLYAARPEGVLVSVGAESFEPGDGLSATVRRAIPAAVRAAVRAAQEGAGPASSSDA